MSLKVFKTNKNMNMNKKIKERVYQNSKDCERIALTMADCGENHIGNQQVGTIPVAGTGFKASDIDGMAPYFEKLYESSLIKQDNAVQVLNLNELSGVDNLKKMNAGHQGRVLVLRNWMANIKGAMGFTDNVYNEVVKYDWDKKYLDPNKYREEIVNGEKVRIRGKILNKKARENKMFVKGMTQKADYINGKGTIEDVNKMPFLKLAVDILQRQISESLIACGSKTQIKINVVEGNRYYDLKKTGIGFHGDTERVVVICLTIGGGGGYPMRFQWFKDGMPIGNSIDLALNDGDVYIMSEKAVGADWKLRSKYTLRHAAGADKYRSLKKWEKRASKKAEIKGNIKNVIKKVENKKINKKVENKKINKKVENNSEAMLKKKEETLKKKEEVALKKKIKMEKALERKKKKEERALKLKEDREANPEKYYKKALKKLSWDDSRKGFYEWLAVQAEYECAPNHEYFKEFQDIWTGKADNFSSKMDIDEFEKHSKFYNRLCEYMEFM